MNDWTFDLFMEDCKLYKATPMRGVHCASNASDREKFMVWFKNAARDFTEAWKKSHAGMHDRYDGWIGDAFAEELKKILFSDFYKETFGQRPHLPTWFYIQALDFPMLEDTAWTFCASPVEDAMENAKRLREMLKSA